MTGDSDEDVWFSLLLQNYQSPQGSFAYRNGTYNCVITCDDIDIDEIFQHHYVQYVYRDGQLYCGENLTTAEKTNDPSESH